MAVFGSAVAGIVALLVAAGIAHPAAAQQSPIVIKFSPVVTVDTPKGKAAQRFRELAEERSKGRENDAALRQIRASGKVQVIALSDAERAEWKETLWPAHKEMEPRVCAALLESVYESAGTSPP